MNNKLNSLIEDLKGLTLFEAVELVKEMEKTFEIDTSAVSSNAFIPASAAVTQTNAPIVEEQTSFQVILTEVPADKKISILKVVRNVTGLGLKESKDIVDNVPKVLKEGASKEETETIRKEIESLGGKISIK
jgi:large subunit ribosomal protein L7/L12